MPNDDTASRSLTQRIRGSLPSLFDLAKVGFRLFGLPRNAFGSIDVTERCNLRCKHCYFFEHDQPEQALSVDDWVALIERWKQTRSRLEFPFFQCFLYRSISDSFDLRGSVVYTAKSFRIGGTMRLETSAVPASHIDAAAIDGLKLDPSLAAKVKVWRGIHVSAGYAFTWMFHVSTGASVFDPTAASACAQAGGDLTNPACQARMNGQARPSAAGDYRLWRQTLSVLTTFGF